MIERIVIGRFDYEKDDDLVISELVNRVNKLIDKVNELEKEKAED